MSSSVLRSSLWWPLPLWGSYTSGGWPQVDFSPLLVHIWPIFDKQNKTKNTLNMWKHEVDKQVETHCSECIWSPLSRCPPLSICHVSTGSISAFQHRNVQNASRFFNACGHVHGETDQMSEDNKRAYVKYLQLSSAYAFCTFWSFRLGL